LLDCRCHSHSIHTAMFYAVYRLCHDAALGCIEIKRAK
jgi:hypothetical protein